MTEWAIYLEKITSVGGVCCGAAVAAINFWIFPEKTLMYAAIAVLIAMVMDVATKYYALSVQNGGYRKARRNCEISSHKFWRGISIKLITYAAIVILAGLSYRITTLEAVGSVLSGVMYGAMFFREVQSITENLHAAGGDVGWLRALAKKREKQILDLDEEEGEDL